jgi:integrase/recombinase XerD
LRRGGSIYRLQQLLRHSSIKTTEIYLRYLTPEEAERSKIAM